MSDGPQGVRARRTDVAWLPVFAATACVVLLHLAVNALDGYGIFRDEYYYLACARRLAWGYVDQPPLSLALLALQTAILGDSLFALRVLPALLSGGVVLFAGLTARELGGGRPAQASSAWLAVLVPCFLGFGGYYSMNIIDLTVWAAVILLIARLANGASPRTWIAVGVLLGVGLLNKLSVLYLGVGIAAVLVLTPLRRHLRTPWPWATGALALLISAPHWIWQIANGWPTLEFVQRAAQYKNVAQTPLSFLVGVAFEGSPFFVPLWLVALGFGFFARERARFRWAAWLSATVVAVLAVTGSAKPYYADPAFFPLVALFGLAFERWLRAAWLRGLAGVYVVATGLVTMPFAIPVLPVERFVAYGEALGLSQPAAERSELGRLPQFYADRFGWVELAEAVSEAYLSLGPEERRVAVVFGQNYGQAASLEYYADRFELPRVISAHNSYWMWGPGDVSGDVWLVIGDGRERLEEVFESVELAAVKRCRDCMPYENEQPVWICRGLRVDPDELWLEIKNFI